ncbi:LexA family transcriptional regulator [Flavobacterium sp. UMI-01]|uniref:LexA family transcriptional regulator n=1 Tax=Flavobacterium sp. UMI-01 TaxID=1441053 RepID=UPI001C7D7037|nr:LexA family transcriptional regulator [Flavobacterium sp. UMI-01]GIZ10248.1 transcriptional regulator [Flavobacterium sp. UMI-01]
MTKIERVRKLCKWLIYDGFADNDKDLAEKIGYTKSSFSQILNEKVPLSDKFIDKLCSANENINKVWVFRGEGEILKNYRNDIMSESANIYPNKTDILQEKQLIPLYDVQASASIVELFNNAVNEKPVDHISIPNLPKCDGAIYVSGDSMYPLLKSGDIIMYKKVGTSIDNMFWGEMYLISLTNDDGDEFVMVKWLHKSDKGEEYVKLVSENRHHQPKDFHIKNIKGLALIKASVRINSMY